MSEAATPQTTTEQPQQAAPGTHVWATERTLGETRHAFHAPAGEKETLAQSLIRGLAACGSGTGLKM